MDHAKLLDVLTSFPVSQSILPRAVCYVTSRPVNHAICSFIDSSGYASGPIRICLFIDYIITWIMSRDFKLLICSLNWTSSDTTGHDTGLGTGLSSSLACGSGDCCDFTQLFFLMA